jgi:hypothetical protein
MKRLEGKKTKPSQQPDIHHLGIFYCFIALPSTFCIATARPFSLLISKLPDYQRRISSGSHLPRFSAGATDTQPAHLSSVFLCRCRQSSAYYQSFVDARFSLFRPGITLFFDFRTPSD